VLASAVNPDLIRRLERIRRSRALPRDAPTLSAAIARESAAITARHRAVGGAWEAWVRGVPPEVAMLGEPASLRRGVLTIRARDGAALYTLDRWLRSGGLEVLRGRSRTALVRVKLTQRGA
jgi:hypothetical protein